MQITVEQEIFTAGKFREIAASGGSRQENFANLELEDLSRNIRVQEIFANLPIFAKFAKIYCTRKFPVLQYIWCVGQNVRQAFRALPDILSPCQTVTATTGCVFPRGDPFGI